VLFEAALDEAGDYQLAGQPSPAEPDVRRGARFRSGKGQILRTAACSANHPGEDPCGRWHGSRRNRRSADDLRVVHGPGRQEATR